MESSSSANDSSVGYGLLGCAGGLLLGFFGGGLGLFGLALVLALQATPVVPQAAPGPDLRLTLQEDFLNRVVQSTTNGQARLDLLPGGQVRLDLDTTVSVLGVSLPVQITSLFGLQATPQAVEVNLVDLQVQGIPMTPEVRDALVDNLPELNQNLNQILANLSNSLGVPLILTGLGTSDSQLWLEASEQP